MNDGMDDCLLFILPVEVLKYIGSFLRPSDLLAASETCHTLRSAFNDDLIWQKYTDGGHISRRLDNIPSIVQPEFAPQQSSTLEPLCQHRLHFMKQSRLLHNLHHGKCVKYSIPFNGFLSDFETSYSLKKQYITYADKYLFTLTYKDDGFSEIVYIFNIKNVPYLFMTLELEKHVDDYSVLIRLQVIKNKLIVRQGTWIDVYQINFPSNNIPLLRSFCIDKYKFQFTFGNLLFYSSSINIIRIWNLEAMEQLNDIHSRIDEQDFRVLSCSASCNQILLCTTNLQMHRVSLYVYNLLTHSYTDFNAIVLPVNYGCCGLIEDVCNVVIFIHETRKDLCDIKVFDIETSIEISNKHDLHLSYLKLVTVLNGYLFLPLQFSILILKLTSLEKVHELYIDRNSLIHEIPHRNCFQFVRFIHFSKKCLMMVICKSFESEIWNFEKMLKVNVLPDVCSDVTETVSKLIILSGHNLTIASYW